MNQFNSSFLIQIYHYRIWRNSDFQMFPEADVSMTKRRRLLLHLLPDLLCVCVSSGYWHANGSFLRAASKANSKHTWIATFGKSHPLHLPYTLKCFTLSDFIPLHSHLFAQNHIHDQTWPDPIKVMPGNTSVKPSAIPQAMEAEKKEKKKKSTLLSGFLEQHWGDTERWEKPDIMKDLRGKEFLFLVWSDATGTGLHSQVPEQNRHNLSGLNRTQNRRSQTSVSVCRGVWIPVKPHVCFCRWMPWSEAKIITYVLKLSNFTW